MINRIMPIGFLLGEFVADLQIRGFHHPDLKKDNLGTTDLNEIKIIDFADIIRVEYPYTIDKMSRALMPLIREMNIEILTQFRFGYIARGGLISEKIFRRLEVKNNVVPFDETSIETTLDKFLDNFDERDYRFSEMWSEINFDVLYKSYVPIIRFEEFKNRHMMDSITRYYTNKYYLSVYLNYFEEKDDLFNQGYVLMQLSINEKYYGNSVKSNVYSMMCRSRLKNCKGEEYERAVELKDFLRNIGLDNSVENDMGILLNNNFIDKTIYEVDWRYNLINSRVHE